MLAAVKEIPEAIKRWRDSRESVYNLIAAIAAVLVVVSAATGSRPTDSVAVAARRLGLTPVAEWLTGPALPLFDDRDADVTKVVLIVVLVLLAGMVVVPLIRGY